jgi:phosphoribosylaminoimidazolecarboxamide formyltransferase / IMP cyclohydrolase
MQKKIESALISVFYKDGLEPIARELHRLGITIYSTGGTQDYLEKLSIPCVPVERITNYPSILGGRVKTLHPSVFGGILGRRDQEQDIAEMSQHNIPVMDMVIVDLYPFEETLRNTTEEKLIIEKIDIGGPSMIRAAAKNHKDVVVIAAKEDYSSLVNLLQTQDGITTIEQRRAYAAKAFKVVMDYDIAINNYFNPENTTEQVLRYGENPHQKAIFKGDLHAIFNQLHGKELSYNNLVDVDAAVQLINDFKEYNNESVFAIIKHTNVCGVAARSTVKESWEAALAGDNESAFGGVLVCNNTIDEETAKAISEIFFEVLIAPTFSEEALAILTTKKNRILLQLKESALPTTITKTILNGTLSQDTDTITTAEIKEVGGRTATETEKDDLLFANIICKHLKSNAIALVTNKQLIGKGCGQTSRVDALRQAIAKAKQFNFRLNNAVLASDAFFPFNDCVEIAYLEGVKAFIQPGGSIRDKDSIDYCVTNNLAMLMTGVRHFKH